MLKNKGFKLEKGELSYYEKFRLVMSFTTSPETLARLVNDESWVVRRGVAFNPNTPIETLERLANDESWVVRSWVARNLNTPPETLTCLANDDECSVRRGVAWNSNTPQYIKDYLKIKEFLNYYD